MEYLRERASRGDKAAQRDLEPLNVEVNALIWEAFRLLNRSRDRLLDGVAGLKIREMVAVLDLLGVRDQAQMTRAVRVLTEMDDAYKEWRATNDANAGP